MQVWTVGTSSAVPTAERALACNMVNYDGERILFDCGEGAQRRIMMDKLGLMQISKIFISHWHADHFSGLLGLIQTMEMEGREKPLHIYGPPRTEEFTHNILDTGYFNRSYDIVVEDLTGGEEIVGEKYSVKPFEVEHGINAFGYVFQEDEDRKANKQKLKEHGLENSPKVGELKNGNAVEHEGRRIMPDDVVEQVPGRKVVYTGDTELCPPLVENSMEADLLIHEATGLHELISDREGHSSARQAATVAEKAGVERLVLTHISRRYRGEEEKLLEEAREVFERTELAEDGMEFEIKPHRPE